MVSLIQRAEAWGKATLAADRPDRSEAEAEPEEWQSFEKRADSFFAAESRLDDQPRRSSIRPRWEDKGRP